MPMYEFKPDESGDLWLEFYDCNEVPSIGQTITRDGREWTRVFCGHCGLKRTNTKALGYPFVSESLPRDCDLGVPRDKKGSPDHQEQEGGASSVGSDGGGMWTGMGQGLTLQGEQGYSLGGLHKGYAQWMAQPQNSRPRQKPLQK